MLEVVYSALIHFDMREETLAVKQLRAACMEGSI